jgi:hypothetical protein
MTNKRSLVIGPIRIYFADDGSARYEAKGKTQRSVELELVEYQSFIEPWLQAVEPPLVPHKRTPEEEEFFLAVKATAKAWQRFKFSNGRIAVGLRFLKHSRDTVSEEMADSIIEEIILSL